MIFSVIPAVILQTTSMTSAPTPLELVEVRGTARQIELGSVSGVSSLTQADIASEAPTHPNELFDQVPGTWVSRGSGQESLISIRSPVLTGAGACGAFMIIEDRVPIRPAGFCNVNELFEVNLLQASQVDVIRGPGSAIYGSNALHGVIDVSSGDPTGASLSGGITAGSFDYYRGRAEISAENTALFLNYTDSRSFRDDEFYQHGFANGVWDSSWFGAEVRTQFSAADIDQDTAGFIFGEDAYLDETLRTGNVNPEAFRKASALRVSSRWLWQLNRGAEFEVIPYLRSSDMDFLQHFLPGKPLETNGQDSFGLLLSWSSGSTWQAGVDLEWADGFLTEFQKDPTQGSPFLMETRPQGFHYDYEVKMLMGAIWGQWQHKVSDTMTLTAGIRLERIDYDYDNLMLDGNTRDDGTQCGFGGCLYTRPADRSDHFDNVAPELGFNWSLSENTTLIARIARGFRPPQVTELYRLQRGQTVADLSSETLDTVEVGLRSSSERLSWDATAFAMRKDHVIFRDADGFNVSDGKTDHLGLEASAQWQIADQWSLNANASWAEHQYDFDRPASRITKGNAVDTAPEWLIGARLNFAPTPRLRTELEWLHMDDYYLDPANAHRYSGHDLLHLRAFYQVREKQQLSLRITNLLDERYAERADFAFGNYRYFPGADRRFFFEWRYQP